MRARGATAACLVTASLGLGCAARSPLPREVRHVGPVGCAAPDVWHHGNGGYDGRRAALVIRCWRLQEAEFRRGGHDVTRPPAGGDRDACRAYARILADVYAFSGDEKITPSKVRALLSNLCVAAAGGTVAGTPS